MKRKEIFIFVCSILAIWVSITFLRKSRPIYVVGRSGTESVVDLEKVKKLKEYEGKKWLLADPYLELFHKIKEMESALLHNLPLAFKIAQGMEFGKIELPLRIESEASPLDLPSVGQQVVSSGVWKEYLSVLEKRNIQVKTVHLVPMGISAGLDNAIDFYLKIILETPRRKTFIVRGGFLMQLLPEEGPRFLGRFLAIEKGLSGAEGFNEIWEKAINTDGNQPSFIMNDFDGDGDVDIFSVTQSIFLLNNGKGKFDQMQRLPFAEHFISGIGHDFNGDGLCDLLLQSAQGSLHKIIMARKMDQVIMKSMDFSALGKEKVLMAVADLDFDGQPDILAAKSTSWPHLAIGHEVVESPFLSSLGSEAENLRLHEYEGVSSFSVFTGFEKKKVALFSSGVMRGVEAWSLEKGAVKRLYSLPRSYGGGGELDIANIKDIPGKVGVVAGHDSYALSVLNSLKLGREEYPAYNEARMNLKGNPLFFSLDNGSLYDWKTIPHQGFSSTLSGVDANADGGHEIFFGNGFQTSADLVNDYDFNYWLFDFYPEKVNLQLGRSEARGNVSWFGNQPDSLLEIRGQGKVFDRWPHTGMGDSAPIFAAGEDIDNDGSTDMVHFSSKGLIKVFRNGLRKSKKYWVGFGPLGSQVLPEKFTVTFKNGKLLEHSWGKTVKTYGSDSGRIILSFDDPAVNEIKVSLANGKVMKLKNIRLNRYYFLGGGDWEASEGTDPGFLKGHSLGPTI